MPNFQQDIHPITELKTNAARIVEHARRSRRPVLLTRRGRGIAVLLDVGEYEALVDRARFIEAVVLGARAARSQRLRPNQEALAILDSFGEVDGS